MSDVHASRPEFSSQELRVGDSLDFRRVKMVDPGRLIRLRAEMKVPGRAWLEFEARPEPQKKTLLLQTPCFEPKVLFGLLYWYPLYPVHSLIFSGLIRRIVEQATGKSRLIKQPRFCA